MVKAEIVLGALKAFLNGPAQAGGAGKLGQRGFLWREGEIIGPLVGLLPVAPDQHPALEALFANPRQGNPRPIVQAQPLGAFACRVGRPGFAVKGGG